MFPNRNRLDAMRLDASRCMRLDNPATRIASFSYAHSQTCDENATSREAVLPQLHTLDE
jgi:hypothetical protein